MPEQVANADQVERLGFGRKINDTTLTPEVLRRAVEDVHDDQNIRENVANMSEKLRSSDGAATAADAIESCFPVGRIRRRLKEALMTTTDPTRKARFLLGTAFTGAGIAHVAKREWFEQLVPESMARWRRPIGTITAAIQIVSGISMFSRRTRGLARWTTVGLLVPTLPAAADQINHPETLRKAGVPPVLAPVRVVAQILVVVLAWWATKPAQDDQR